MNSKPGIFDPVKQPATVKTYNSNQSSKSSHYNNTNERNTSPFRSGYKDNPKADIRLSQGASTHSMRNPVQYNYDVAISHETNSNNSGINALVSQQFQEVMEQEFQSLITQWRDEIFDEVRHSLVEYNTKSHRNKDTMEMIKQHLRSNTQSIDEIDEKLSDYDLKLENIGVLIKQELQTIKTNISSRRYEEGRQNYSENVSLPAIKQEIMEELTDNIDEFNRAQSTENTTKFQQLQSELSEALQGKMTKVADHLNNKISIIEKQIKSLENAEDPEIDKVKYEIEGKLQESSQSLKEQMHSLKKLIETAAAESQNVSQDSLETSNSSQIDTILTELSKAEQNLREIQRHYEKKIDEFEEKWHEQFGKIEAELKSCSEEVRRLMNRIEGNKIEGNVSQSQLSKIISLRHEVDGLISSQKFMQSELYKIDQNINEIKYMKAEATGGLSKKSFSDIPTDPRIKKLEEQIESITKVVDSAKLQNANLLGGLIGSNSTTTTLQRYNMDLAQQTQNLKSPKRQIHSFNSNLSPLADEALNHKTDFLYSKYDDHQYQQWKLNNNLGPGNSPPRDKLRIEKQAEESANYSIHANNLQLGGTLENNNALNAKMSNHLNDLGVFQSRNHQRLPERYGELQFNATFAQGQKISSLKYDDKGGDLLQGRNDSVNLSPGRIHDSLKIDRKYGNQPFNEKLGDYSSQFSQGTYSLSRTNEKSPPRLESPGLGNIKALSPGTGYGIHKINNELPRHTEGEEEEIVYQLDENGFLMDEDGNYILDEQGQMIKLNEEHIERLRANNLLEEEN